MSVLPILPDDWLSLILHDNPVIAIQLNRKWNERYKSARDRYAASVPFTQEEVDAHLAKTTTNHCMIVVKCYKCEKELRCSCWMRNVIGKFRYIGGSGVSCPHSWFPGPTGQGTVILPSSGKAVQSRFDFETTFSIHSMRAIARDITFAILSSKLVHITRIDTIYTSYQYDVLGGSYDHTEIHRLAYLRAHLETLGN